MSDSDSDLEDDTIKMMQSCDVNFLNDEMFTNIGKLTNSISEPVFSTAPDSKCPSTIEEKSNCVPVPLKSQRYVEYEGDDFDDWNSAVPPGVQDFVSKKMREKIAQTIEFVDVVGKSIPSNTAVGQENADFGIRLLSDSQVPIKQLKEDNNNLLNFHKTSRSIIRRRIPDEDTHITEKVKIRLAAVTAEEIIAQKEIANWSRRKRSKILEFRRDKNNIFHFIEPPNEFTELRIKNGWSEERIARKN